MALFFLAFTPVPFPVGVGYCHDGKAGHHHDHLSNEGKQVAGFFQPIQENPLGADNLKENGGEAKNEEGKTEQKPEAFIFHRKI